MTKLFTLVFLFSINFISAQVVEGFVLDEDSNPIPFAKVWVKNYDNLGTVTRMDGYYKIVFDAPNACDILYSVIGYEDQLHNVIIPENATVQKDVYLKESNNQLGEVEVKQKKSNVGYEIIKKVIQRKKGLEYPIDAFTCNMYVKGSESFDRIKRKKDTINEELSIDDKQLNYSESFLKLSFQAPNNVKEIKTAHSIVGYPNQIYLYSSPVYVDAYFNFYSNLLHKNRLHETPIVSPLHNSGILSYKYNLAEILVEEGDTIYRIHIKPRNFGTSTMEGDLFVKKHEWVLTKVDLCMHKGNLKAYDDFRIIQNYEKINEAWIVTKQQFIYKAKYGRDNCEGRTEVIYSDFDFNPKFPEKYFNNEIASTIDDAYDKDSLFWDEKRPVKLTKGEQRKKFVQDSVYAAHNKVEYLDSIMSDYSKIWVKPIIF